SIPAIGAARPARLRLVPAAVADMLALQDADAAVQIVAAPGRAGHPRGRGAGAHAVERELVIRRADASGERAHHQADQNEPHGAILRPPPRRGQRDDAVPSRAPAGRWAYRPQTDHGSIIDMNKSGGLIGHCGPTRKAESRFERGSPWTSTGRT